MLYVMAGKAKSGELALIQQIRERAGVGSGAVHLGIGDDCAILRPRAGEDLVVTTDFTLEGRHFRRDWHTPRSVGHRTLARGLSDLAAMGAKPVAAFLSLAITRNLVQKKGWIDAFLDGFLHLGEQFGTVLAGGDTSESPSEHVLADVVLMGSVPRGRALRRSGARAGDFLYCTGSLGGAVVELAELEKSPRRFRAAKASGDHPHLFPVPRVKAGQALLKRGLATACMDISDGLSTDLAHLCESSGVSAEVEADRLPLHPLARGLDAEAGLAAALHGGEDYELLFTAQAGTKTPRVIGGVPVTRIGTITAKRKGTPQVTLVDADGVRTELAPQGWEHLR